MHTSNCVQPISPNGNSSFNSCKLQLCQDQYCMSCDGWSQQVQERAWLTGLADSRHFKVSADISAHFSQHWHHSKQARCLKYADIRKCSTSSPTQQSSVYIYMQVNSISGCRSQIAKLYSWGAGDDMVKRMCAYIIMYNFKNWGRLPWLVSFRRLWDL